MGREIRGAKINPKSSFKNQGAQNTRGRKLPQQIRYIYIYIYIYIIKNLLRNTKIIKPLLHEADILL